MAEHEVGATLTADFGATKGDNRDYFVPDFGLDHDIIATAEVIKSTEKKLHKAFTADYGATSAPVNPRDYFVPDFGIDHDILNTTGSIRNAEA